MKAIELDRTIGAVNRILAPDDQTTDAEVIDPMKYSNTVDWLVDGPEYQQKMREEWQ